MPRAIGFTLGSVGSVCAGVELLGCMDNGVSTVSNTSGHSGTMMSSGITTPSYFALRGAEDLADGNRALLHLQMNYQVGEGTQPAAVPAFSSAAYVGLTNPRLGTLTLGCQKDFTPDLAVIRLDAALDIGGIYALRGGPYGKLGLPLSPNGTNWDRLNGIAASNAIKYVTPDLNGVAAGAIHRLGEEPGSASRNSGDSLFLRYASGPLAAGAVCTRIKFPTVNLGQDGAAIVAAGAR